MNLLDVPGPGATAHTLVAVFGGGLVGGAIVDALVARHGAVVRPFPYEWTNDAVRQDNTSHIRQAIRDSVETGRTSRVVFVWAAGRSGFGSDEVAMRTEGALLAEIVALCDGLCRDCPGVEFAFHLTSSAGGIFEGATNCGADTPPAPCRPYGFGKLAQEAQMRALAETMDVVIYRPSSVYGYRPKARLGLISALIRNALKGQVTRISGRSDTLRDFVLADDIGRFVAQRALAPETKATQTFLLASGRPTALFQIFERVQTILAAPVFLGYDPAPTNTANMCFSMSALPKDWHPTALETGMVAVARDIRQYFWEHPEG